MSKEKHKIDPRAEKYPRRRADIDAGSADLAGV